jgi:ABC-type glycerol-3-phosphate transport system substrate-binding protein
MKKAMGRKLTFVMSIIILMAISLYLVGCSNPAKDSSTKGSTTKDETTESDATKDDTTKDSTADDNSKRDIKIKIVMDNNSTEKYEELFKNIGDELGIEIELAVAPGNYEQFLQTQLQSSEKPDLFKVNTQDLTGFVDDGMTTDLNTYFNGTWKETLGTDDWNKLTKGPFDQRRREADNARLQTDDPSAPLWAIPFDAGCQSFGVNRGIIEGTPELTGKVDELIASGVIPCKPWEVGMEGQVETYTYTEFAGLLKGLQEVIDTGNLTGMAENLKYAFAGVDALKLMTYSSGGSFLNSNHDTVTLTDDAVVNVAYFIKNGINEGYIDSMQDGGEGWNNWVSGSYLVNGNTGTWEYGTYLENVMTISMLPIPVPDSADRSKWVSGQTGSSLILRNGSSNVDMAAKVMCEFISRSSEEFQLKNALNMPLYDDTWNDYINNNDENNGGFFPYDANTKTVFNKIISGAHGQVQETYYTLGRNWWSTFMTNYANMFSLDKNIVTQQDVIDWLDGQQSEIQTLLEQGK